MVLMKNQPLYDIEYYMETPVDRWSSLPSFRCMRRSFAEGAWAMLKAHYNQPCRHRLVRDGEVIDEIGRQQVKVCSPKPIEKGSDLG
jgi:hypothetical protein